MMHPSKNLLLCSLAKKNHNIRVRKHHPLLQTAQESQRAYDLAKARFDAGAVDFEVVLNAQQSQIQASDTVVQARLDKLTALIALYKSLGGAPL